jgi:hypothetical protein
MTDLPADPTTPAQRVGIALHEMYKMYLAGGFTEEQALKLIAYGVVANAQNAPDDGGDQ